MTTSPEERKDLDQLQADTLKEQASFSSLCRMYLEMENNPEQLRHSGHKSVADALLYGAKHHVKTLNNLVKAHIKKWPDK